MAKAESENRGYPQVTKGLVDQRTYYRATTKGRAPLLANVTLAYSAGTTHLAFSPGNFTGTFTPKRKVCLIVKGQPIILAVVESRFYRTPGNFTDVYLAQPVVPAHLDDVGILLTLSGDGWAQIADAIDSDIYGRLADIAAAEGAAGSLRSRLDATLTDAGTASTIARPAPELRPAVGSDPRAFYANGAIAKVDDQTISASTPDKKSFAELFGQSLQGPPPIPVNTYLVMIRAGGERIQTYVVDSVDFEDETGVIETRCTVIADGPPVPADIVNVEVSQLTWSMPQLTPSQLADGLIPPEKFFPRLASGSLFQAEKASSQDALNTQKARAADAEAAHAAHAASGTVHGVSGSIVIGTTETAALVTEHDTDPTAHLAPGQAFSGIQRTVERGRANGYVPLDAVGQIEAQYLPGPYGVKRVLNTVVAVSTALSVDVQLDSLLATPLALPKSALFASIETTVASAEPEAYVTVELLGDGTGVRVKHGDTTGSFASNTRAAITIVEFY